VVIWQRAYLLLSLPVKEKTALRLIDQSAINKGLMRQKNGVAASLFLTDGRS
jgi:hypothetical protein